MEVEIDDCMVREEVIEGIQFLEWAAPVAPVLKRDGSVRLCGDWSTKLPRWTLLPSDAVCKLDCFPFNLYLALYGSHQFSLTYNSSQVNCLGIHIL